MMKIGIIDYGMGNIQSLKNSLHKIDLTAEIVSDKHGIEQCDLIILPGVGAFPEAMSQIDNLGLKEVINKHVNMNKPLIGICLGMQLLFSRSSEFLDTLGLNYIEGHVSQFIGQGELRIPHMGWNEIWTKNDDFIDFQGDYYFVHSFYCKPDKDEYILFTANYGIDFCAGVKKNNIYGIQFHPEKSQKLGLKLLRKIITSCSNRG